MSVRLTTQLRQSGIGIPECVQGSVVSVCVQCQPTIAHQAPECTHKAVRLMSIAEAVKNCCTRDSSVVLNNTELMTELSLANGSMREEMNRVKRLARLAQYRGVYTSRQ